MNPSTRRPRRWGLAAVLGAVLTLGACDPQAIKELEEGVSTEADVVQRFGQPERVWPEAGGAKTYEYNRQPEGLRNYMITIGADGKMSALRQVLTPENFARVQPGQGVEDVRRMLGKPARQLPLPLKNQTVWTWTFLEPPSTTKAFNVFFGPDMRVQRTEIGPDPDGPEMRGGG